MKTYQNLTDRELSLPDVGLVPPHGTIQTDKIIENQNFKLITNDDHPLPPQSEPVELPVAPAPTAPTSSAGQPQPTPAAPEQEEKGEN